MTQDISGPSYEEQMQSLCDTMLDGFRQDLENLKNEFLLALQAQTNKASVDNLKLLDEQARHVASDLKTELKLTTNPRPLVVAYPVNEPISPGQILVIEHLAYAPDTNTLQVFHEGNLLTHGVDYRETTGENGVSHSLELLKPFMADTVFVFYCYPLNSAHKAEIAAEDAENSRRQAALHLQSTIACKDQIESDMRTYTVQARQATEQIASAASNASRSIEQAAADASDSGALAKDWADVSKKYSQDAYNCVSEGYKVLALTQAQSTRPGIIALPNLQSLLEVQSGFYIINPNISEPTRPLGIYAANSIDDMNFDAIFYIGKQNTPQTEPPIVHIPPAHVGISGNSNDWLPCPHNH